MKKYTVMAVGIVMCLFSHAFADDATLDAAQDAFVSDAVPTLPTGLEGYVAVAHDWELGLFPTTKGLIQFNIASLGSVASVQSATLRLHMLTVTGPGQVEFLRAGGSWNEMTTTWNSRPSEDRGENALANVTGTGAFEVDVTDIIAAWVEGFANNGFYIDVPDNGEAVDFQFASKEHPSAGNRPKLDITYTTGVAVAETAPGKSASLEVAPVSAGSAKILFSIPVSGQASLNIHDASGAHLETLVDGQFEQGEHHVSWDASPGVYFIRFETARDRIVRKFVSVR